MATQNSEKRKNIKAKTRIEQLHIDYYQCVHAQYKT